LAPGLKALEVENKIKEERASSKDKGGTCLKCSESDKRKSAVSTVSRIR
jgi:hypothetical protein